jgi:hypothetical protein
MTIPQRKAKRMTMLFVLYVAFVLIIPLFSFAQTKGIKEASVNTTAADVGRQLSAARNNGKTPKPDLWMRAATSDVILTREQQRALMIAKESKAQKDTRLKKEQDEEQRRLRSIIQRAGWVGAVIPDSVFDELKKHARRYALVRAIMNRARKENDIATLRRACWVLQTEDERHERSLLKLFEEASSKNTKNGFASKLEQVSITKGESGQ